MSHQAPIKCAQGRCGPGNQCQTSQGAKETGSNGDLRHPLRSPTSECAMTKRLAACAVCTTVITLVVCEGCAHGRDHAEHLADPSTDVSMCLHVQAKYTESSPSSLVQSECLWTNEPAFQVRQRYVPLEAITNALSYMDQIVEARCIWLVGLTSLERHRPVESRHNLAELPKQAQLTRNCFREIICSISSVPKIS